MAHIITSIGQEFRPSKTTLSCMNSVCKKVNQKDIHDAEGISKRIEQAANTRRQLDADIFERDKRILQSAEAKNKI